ncbi:hypothetical protein FQA39_LY07108 [Lamprigera yunnana]|nr:hypothetical protein FQA39_LY07108 [Lamprigera yunnana]
MIFHTEQVKHTLRLSKTTFRAAIQALHQEKVEENVLLHNDSVEEVKLKTDDVIADDGMEEGESNPTEPKLYQDSENSYQLSTSSSEDGSDNEPVNRGN